MTRRARNGDDLQVPADSRQIGSAGSGLALRRTPAPDRATLPVLPPREPDHPTLPVAPRSRVVDLATPAAPAAPLDPVADEWVERTKRALKVVDKGLDLTQPLGMEPDEYRARLAAAGMVLGVKKSGLPMPTPKGLGLGELEVKDRVIRLRWSDGRPVVLPLHDPHARRRAGDDDEEDA